ncbi:hypothetical protein E4T47_04396 [Aureobasidium subglaciale]|nr:hypothetical protein E4T47_04396 [Aureobasidium subglaciale]
MYGQNYGRLVPWEKEAAERWDIVGYPRARLVIEAQALMFSRLRSIEDLVLEDVDRESFGASDKWQEMVQVGFKQFNNIELWFDYINQPFLNPPRFDVDYHCSVANARMQAAHDHSWLLQSDPAYVRRFVKTMAIGEVYRSDWRCVIIADDFRQAVKDYLRWQELDNEWSCVQELYRRFRDSIHQGQALPRRLELSLALLEVAILREIDRKTLHLYSYVIQRPGFRSRWQWTMNKRVPGRPDRVPGSYIRTDLTSEAQLYHEDPLEWIMMNLLGEPYAERRFDHAELFTKLESHMAEASPTERARLDETVYGKLSDFAALLEMLSAVRMHRPAFASRGPADRLDMIKQNSTPFTRSLAPDGTKVLEMMFPSELFNFFDKSAQAVGRKDKVWLDHRTAERKALARFWDQARSTLSKELGGTRMEREEIDSVLTILSVSTTTEYAEIVKQEELQVVEAEASAAARLTKRNTKAQTGQQTVWNTGPDISKLAIHERVPKPKTRPSEPVNGPVAPEPIEDTPSPQPIPTTPRALEVLKKMFPTTAEETAAKTTDWDLFVHAMNDLNFAARNVGGSAVAFEHASKRKIIFHRPHPVAKVDSVMLQSMGKRMKKHFGWCREGFVEA